MSAEFAMGSTKPESLSGTYFPSFLLGSFTDLLRDANQIDLQTQAAAISTACVPRIPFRHLQSHERAPGTSC